ncbi:MAG: hypothetical protein ACI4I9_01885 [Porcipelethomonas sp.]
MKKLSYRDRIIVLIALVFMIIFAGIYLVIKPAFENISRARSDYEQAEKKWSEAQNMISQIDDMQKRVDTKYNESVEFSGWFVDEKAAYTLDQFMQDYFDRYGIYINNLSVTGAGVTTLDPYSSTKEEITYPLKEYADISGTPAADSSNEGNSAKNEDSAEASETVAFGTVNLDYTTTKDQLIAFMQEIKDSGKTIEINSVDLGPIYTNPQYCTGNMQITVYYVEPISSLEPEPTESGTEAAVD